MCEVIARNSHPYIGTTQTANKLKFIATFKQIRVLVTPKYINFREISQVRIKAELETLSYFEKVGHCGYDTPILL